MKIGDLVCFKHNRNKAYVVTDVSRWFAHLYGMHPSQVVSIENLEVIKCPKLD